MSDHTRPWSVRADGGETFEDDIYIPGLGRKEGQRLGFRARKARCPALAAHRAEKYALLFRAGIEPEPEPQTEPCEEPSQTPAAAEVEKVEKAGKYDPSVRKWTVIGRRKVAAESVCRDPVAVETGR